MIKNGIRYFFAKIRHLKGTKKERKNKRMKKESVVTVINQKGKISAQIFVDWKKKRIEVVEKNGVKVYETKEKGLNQGV